MTTTLAFPTLLETFFTDRLMTQRGASPHKNGPAHTPSRATATPSACCCALRSNAWEKRLQR